MSFVSSKKPPEDPTERVKFIVARLRDAGTGYGVHGNKEYAQDVAWLLDRWQQAMGDLSTANAQVTALKEKLLGYGDPAGVLPEGEGVG